MLVLASGAMQGARNRADRDDFMALRGYFTAPPCSRSRSSPDKCSPGNG